MKPSRKRVVDTLETIAPKPNVLEGIWQSETKSVMVQIISGWANDMYWEMKNKIKQNKAQMIQYSGGAELGLRKLNKSK